jgi:hypothetical protein
MMKRPAGLSEREWAAYQRAVTRRANRDVLNIRVWCPRDACTTSHSLQIVDHGAWATCDVCDLEQDITDRVLSLLLNLSSEK